MKRIFLVFLILIPISVLLYAQEEVNAVKVLKYNKDYNFIVIDQGKIQGLKPGMDFLVAKDGVEIGKIEVVKAKDNISACDVKEIIPEAALKENDIITIYPLKKIPFSVKIPAGARETVPKKEKVKKEKKGFLSSLTSPFKKMFRKDKEVSIPEEVQSRSIQEIYWTREIKGPSVSMDVSADKELTFHILNEMLNEHNIIITHSDRLKGLLTGFKMVPMSIGEEIFADFRGLKEKKLIYDVEVQKVGPKISKINVGLKLILYNRKGSPKVKIIERGGYVKEIQEILSQVKLKAEKLQAEWGG